MLKLLSSGQRGASDISHRAGGNLNRLMEQWCFSRNSLAELCREALEMGDRGKRDALVGTTWKVPGSRWGGCGLEGRERVAISG